MALAAAGVCVTIEGVSGAGADGDPAGGVPGSGVVAGAAVVVVFMVKCSVCASKKFSPNCAFNTSLKTET